MLADLDGDGCSEALRLVDGVLQTPTSASEFSLGELGDVLVAGGRPVVTDQDDDGSHELVVVQPTT